MEQNELNALSALLAEDDFAKGVALGISAEKAEALNRLRTLRPWQDERYSNSDIGNGYLFADFYKNTARFVSERKCWFVYDGRAWRADTGNLQAMEKCKELAVLLFLLTAEITDSTLRDVCLKRAARWHNRSVRETILKDASGVYSLRTADFDRDPYLLNCRNGTLNLQTGEFREHRAEDFLSLISGVSYDANARCPRWERFMEEVMRSADEASTVEKTKYLQKAFGYALTGNTRYECLFILYGATTRNGKGTAMETFLRLMGDYGKTARPETIGPGKKNARPPRAVGGAGEVAHRQRYDHGAIPA